MLSDAGQQTKQDYIPEKEKQMEWNSTESSWLHTWSVCETSIERRAVS